MRRSSPKPCSDGKATSTQTLAGNKSSPSYQNDVNAPQDTGNPCEKTDTQSKSDAGGDTVGWDPVTDWDGSLNSREVAGFFVFGLLVSAPIFLIARRLKSRKSESEAARKILESRLRG